MTIVLWYITFVLTYGIVHTCVSFFGLGCAERSKGYVQDANRHGEMYIAAWINALLFPLITLARLSRAAGNEYQKFIVGRKSEETEDE